MAEARLVPAGVRDLPALALVVGVAMATRPFGSVLRWPIAIAGWPGWLGVLWLSTPYVWRIDHHAVAIVRPPGTSTRPTVRHLAVAVPVTVLVAAAVAVGAHLAGLDTSNLGYLEVGVVVGAFVLGEAGLYPGRLRPGPQIDGGVEPVRVSTLASLRPHSGVLAATRVQLAERWPDHELELVARSTDLVALYEDRFGVHQLVPNRGRMVGRTAPRPD